MSALETVRAGALEAASRERRSRAGAVRARTRTLYQEACSAVSAALRLRLDSRPWRHLFTHPHDECRPRGLLSPPAGSVGREGPAVATSSLADPAGPAMVHPLLAARIEEVDNTHVVHLTGEIDISVCALLRRWVVEARGAVVLVDVANVTFIDAAGVGTVVAAERELATRGCLVSVTGARGLVRRVFELCDLAHLLDDEASGG